MNPHYWWRVFIIPATQGAWVIHAEETEGLCESLHGRRTMEFRCPGGGPQEGEQSTQSISQATQRGRRIFCLISTIVLQYSLKDLGPNKVIYTYNKLASPCTCNGRIWFVWHFCKYNVVFRHICWFLSDHRLYVCISLLTSRNFKAPCRSSSQGY